MKKLGTLAMLGLWIGGLVLFAFVAADGVDDWAEIHPALRIGPVLIYALIFRSTVNPVAIGFGRAWKKRKKP